MKLLLAHENSRPDGRTLELFVDQLKTANVRFEAVSFMRLYFELGKKL
jgi:hypothetical protein